MINQKNAAKYVSQASDKLYDAYEVARWNKIENQYQIIEGHLVGVCTELNPDSYIGTMKKIILANAMTSYYGSIYVINHAKGYYSARFILKAYLRTPLCVYGCEGGIK